MRKTVREKLAALLQKSFPTKGSLKLVWKAEWLYPAQGAWRTGKLDCYRWEGYAMHVASDGTYGAAVAVGSYLTMTELIKADLLTISASDEVVPA